MALHQAKSKELRRKWWTIPLAYFLWVVMQLICRTLRIRYGKRGGGSQQWPDGNVIITLWHNRTFPCIYAYVNIMRGAKPICILTSASKDGTMLAEIAARFGVKAARGSTGRRGTAGFLNMIEHLDEGDSMCITPDGSRGPCYHFNQGAVKLASMTGVPILPLCVEFSDFWRINKAWDRYIIAKPFSEVIFQWGDLIHVPANADDETIREYTEIVAAQMSYGAPDFKPLEYEYYDY